MKDGHVKGTFYPPEDPKKNIRYVNTPHGRFQLFYNGFLYNRNMSSPQKTYWRCTMNGKLKCSARVIGTINGLTLSKPQHNHEPCDFPEEKLRRGGLTLSKYEFYSELSSSDQ